MARRTSSNPPPQVVSPSRPQRIDPSKAGYVVLPAIPAPRSRAKVAMAATAAGPLTPGAGPPKTGAGLVQILQDNFTLADLDDASTYPDCPWNTGYPWGQTLGPGHEYYTRFGKAFPTVCDVGGVNHVYADGKLSLRAKLEPGEYEIWDFPEGDKIVPSCKHYDITSAMLFSKQKFLYGHFEITCTIPPTDMPLWPSFWLWAGDPYREIDVFEFATPDKPNNLIMSLHIDEGLDFGRVHRDPKKTEPVNDYGAQLQLPEVSEFHSYAVQWRPNSVTWLVDNMPVWQLAGHSPPLPMHVIVGLGTMPELDPPSPLPKDMVIDRVRISRFTDPEFLYHWGNGGSGILALWSMRPSDRYVPGDFSGTGRTQILAVAEDRWSQLFDWDGAAWQHRWGNSGSNQIALWQMRPSDRYFAGDFNGDGRDELLVMAAANGWSHMMRWDGSAWQFAWGNGGSNQIGPWKMRPTDRYVVGDFDGDGRDELLVLAASNGWSHLVRWDGSAWQYLWGNNGGGQIGAWNINAVDRYIAADFDGDGKAELLVVAGDHWAHLLEWDGAGWQNVWSNGGDDLIGLWHIGATERFVAGDFEGSGRSALAAFSGSTWAHAMRWDGSKWQYIWGNDGGQTVHRWFMNPTDRYLVGRFDGVNTMLLAIAENGWSHLLKFEPVP